MARTRLFGLLLVLLTILLYLPLRQAPFVVFDDPEYVSENGLVQRGLTWEGLQWAFWGWHASNWHPLTWVSHMLDCELFGLNAGAHHLINVLVHAVNAALLLSLLMRLTRRLWPSLLVAAFFAWHPLRVESVAWISERKDVLCTLFWLLTLWAYAGYALGPGPAETSPASPPGKHSLFPVARRWYALALVFFGLGLLAKPMIVTLPFVLLLLDVWPLGRLSPDRWRGGGRLCLLEKLPFVLLSCAVCVVTVLAQHQSAMISFETLPLPLRLGNAVLACGTYLFQLFWPLRLAVFYPIQPTLSWESILLVGLLLAAITFLCLRGYRSRPYWLIGWFWFLGTLVPVLGLIQVGGQAHADRYTYIPQIGLLWALVWEACRLMGPARGPRRLLGATLAVCLLAACVAGTRFQLQFWSNSERLFARALEVTARNPTADLNLGVTLEKQRRFSEAREHYEAALRLQPNWTMAHVNLAGVLAKLGQPAAALAEYRLALNLDPGSERVHLNLASMLAGTGHLQEALQEYARAQQLAPADLRPWFMQGLWLLSSGHSAQAVSAFQEALARNEADLKTLLLLARVRACDPSPAVRDGPAAVQLAQKAVALTAGQDFMALDVLALACAETGRFEQASQNAQRALELARSFGTPAAVAGIQSHLSALQSGQPCRENWSNALPEVSNLPPLVK